MTLDNLTGLTKGSYTGSDLFCKSQLITCNRVKECNGVCPFEDALKHADEDALKHADKEMNEQTVIDHDRDWIIGCIQHDGFIHTHRFDKANQIILDALADRPMGEWQHKPSKSGEWIWWQCSECGAVIYSESEADRKIHHAYCGVCGARMENTK